MNNFCTCTDLACPYHPTNVGGDCGPCIQKNLKEHEIPACFWKKIGQAGGADSDYTFHKFAEALAKSDKALSESL